MNWEHLSSRHDKPEYHLTSADDVRRALAQWKRRCYILATLFIFSVLLTVAYFPTSDNLTTGAVRSEAYFRNIPKEMVQFRLDEAFANAESWKPENRSAWDMLLPLGAGLVEVKNPMNYGLKGGFPVQNPKVMTEIYSISMFHQLYCLSKLKVAFGRERGKGEHHGAEKNLHHCFDYLRQAIMCAGDTTLETAGVNADGDLVPGFDGWGDAHECRSYEAIFDFAKAHRANNDETGHF